MAIMASSVRTTLVQEKLRHGALPQQRPTKANGVPGSGSVCIICTDRVNPPEFQYDCITQNGDTVHLCRQCYFLWLTEVDVRSSQTG
jgi:hypothetical protein